MDPSDPANYVLQDLICRRGVSDQGEFRTRAVVKRFRFLVFFVAAVAAFTSSAQASDRAALRGHYFLVVFGYQGPDNDVVHSHTSRASTAEMILPMVSSNLPRSAGYQRQELCSPSGQREVTTLHLLKRCGWHAA